MTDEHLTAGAEEAGLDARVEAAPTCCSTAHQATCCEPGRKSDCCGAEATTGGGCGCR